MTNVYGKITFMSLHVKSWEYVWDHNYAPVARQWELIQFVKYEIH